VRHWFGASGISGKPPPAATGHSSSKFCAISGRNRTARLHRTVRFNRGRADLLSLVEPNSRGRSAGERAPAFSGLPSGSGPGGGNSCSPRCAGLRGAASTGLALGPGCTLRFGYGNGGWSFGLNIIIYFIVFKSKCPRITTCPQFDRDQWSSVRLDLTIQIWRIFDLDADRKIAINHDGQNLVVAIFLFHFDSTSSSSVRSSESSL